MQSANLPLVKRGPSPLRPLKGFCLAPEHAEQAPLQRQLILQSCWLEGSSAFHHTSRHLRHRSTHAPLRMQPSWNRRRLGRWESIGLVAFCQGWSSVDFRRGGHDYRVTLGTASRLQEACAGKPCDAEQVNQQTGAKRRVKRWPSWAQKQSFEQQWAMQAIQNWENWNGADWAWLLDVNTLVPPSTESPPRRSYVLGCSTFQSEFWPPILRQWPKENLMCAAHPQGERCNFALQRLTAPALTESKCKASPQEWNALQELWQQGGRGSKLLAAFRVQNRGLIEAFTAQQQVMQRRLAEDHSDAHAQSLGVRLLWHGTRTVQGLLDICRDGFDRARAQTCAYGKGCYFASSANYSDRYACDVRLPRSDLYPRVRAVFLAAVLVGDCVVGASNMYPPPQKPHSASGERYENACDRLPNPSIFVTFKDHQALPLYIMLYE
ncbi:unnamed protein product [Durusdinium trenchii]